MSKPLICCVERLNIFSLYHVVLLLFKRAFAKENNEISIFYIETTKCGFILAFFVVKLFRSHLKRLVFRLEDVRDSCGLYVRLKCAYAELMKIQVEIEKSSIIKDFFEDETARGRFYTFLIKQITAYGHFDKDNRTIWRGLILIHVAEWYAKRHTEKETETVLILYRRPWIRELQNYGQQHGVGIIPVQFESIFWGLSIRSILPDSIIAMLKVVRCFFGKYKGYRRLKVNPYSSEVGVNKSSISQSKLVVGYYGHLNLHQPEMYSDLFFWQQSELSGKDIVVTFNLTHDPLTEAMQCEITDTGMETVALSQSASIAASTPLFQYFPRSLPSILDVNLRRESKKTIEGKFIKREMRKYHQEYDYWRNLFSQCNIRVFTSWYKYDAVHCAIADAMESLGGITTIYQRSFEEFGSPETTVAADVVFGFSQCSAEVERGQKSIIPYHVTTGYLGDHRFPLLHKPAQIYREKLQRQGVRHIVAFFDENTLDDDRWFEGHETNAENIAFLLEKLLAEPTLGLILKPKVPHTIRARLGNVANLLRRAEESGRCLLLEGGKIQGSFPPAAAALAADVVIHGHLHTGTAGLESALAGVPTLLLDREGWSISKLYRLKKGKVVFTEWDDLWSALTTFIDSPSAIAGFGDWSPLLEELDPYRDGNAANRMGTYLQWLLEYLRTGQSREDAMAKAAERYSAIWGDDKVVKIG